MISLFIKSIFFHSYTHVSIHTGSCLDYGITVCCTPDHCPTQISPDNCYCDTTCFEFDDCCDDIDQVCPPGYIQLHTNANLDSCL